MTEESAMRLIPQKMVKLKLHVEELELLMGICLINYEFMDQKDQQHFQEICTRNNIDPKSFNPAFGW